ncbi:MAG: hypothetical protein KVP17_001994 [Porospora cf. gigantea B]|nr:MAG: hypothetical protein KVP17_001994 [Porospora cf. gigantea B]
MRVTSLLAAYHAVTAAAADDHNPAVIINWNKECLNEGRMPHSTPFGSVLTHSITEQDDSNLTSKELAAVNRIRELGIRDSPAQLPQAEPGSVESYVNRVIDVLTGVSQLDLQAALNDLSEKTTDVVATSTNQELSAGDGVLPLNATPVPDNRNLGMGHLTATFEILGRYIANMPTNSELTPAYLTELHDDVIAGSIANNVAVTLSEILPCVNIVELAKERHHNSIVGHIMAHMPEDWQVDYKEYNDPGARYQWYMGNTWGGWFQQAIEYFDEAADGTTLSEMPVVVIDNECSPGNLDLDFYIRQGCTPSSSDHCTGWDTEDRDSTFWISNPKNAHGTLAASMIAAKSENHLGIVASCPVCKVYCIKAATADGVFYTDALLRAYNHVLLYVSQFKLSNNSYGGPG